MRILLFVLAAALLAGQTLIDLKTQTKRIDFSAAQSTKPVRTGAMLPPTCSVGEMYLQVPAAAGKNLYSCVATNVWALQGAALPSGTVGSVLVSTGNGAYDWRFMSGDVSGGSTATVTGLQGRRVSVAAPADGDTLTWNSNTSEWVAGKSATGKVAVQVDGISSGTSSVQNHITGTGLVITATDTGSSIEMQHAIDTAVVQTRANAQSGADALVSLISNSPNNFVGEMNPTLVQYTDRMFVQFRPNESCSFNPSLDIDTLGTRGLYEADGLTPMQCAAGNQYAIWYDGTSNRWRKYAELPAQTGKAGKYLKTDGALTSWADVEAALPSQVQNAGKYLKTDGTQAAWADVQTLPSQTANAGKYLKTDGTQAVWADVTSPFPTQTANAGKYLKTDGTQTVWADVAPPLPTQTANAGKYLRTDGTQAVWADVASPFPSQTANAGKFLTTNGAQTVWADTLPVQTGNAGRVLTTNGTAATWTAITSISSLGITIDGGGSVITAGVKGYLVVPFACNMENWSIVGDQSGSIVVDVWKSTIIPTVANTITASTRPTLSSSQLAVTQPVTGWTTNVGAGDVLGFNVSSADALTRATLTIACRR